MFTRILDWLDHRAGVRQFLGAMLLEGVPGGARWRYVWGSCLVFVFSIQLITGLMLMTSYSPGSTQAWSSVHFIQYQMDFGWLIRGLHHFGSQTMMVLLVLHMLQVVVAGAHLPPREINWWLGIGLLSVTFGLSLTGYLLPWDQKGYWATRVATNIANNLPVIGPDIRHLMVAGEDYGNLTLTRFYALHVGILPGTLLLLLVFHIYIFRRHGVTSKVNIEGLITKPSNEHVRGTETFWPRQAFYDMIACMIIFGIMLGLVFYGHGHPVESAAAAAQPTEYEYWAKAGQRGLGANLDAAADRDTANYPARPEWYFLFLFQLLKYFDGDLVLIGTVVIPNGVMLLLTLLPLLGYGPMRTFGHWFSILVMMTLIVFAGLLTVKAFMDDAPEGIFWGHLKNDNEESIKKAKSFQHSVEEAEYLARRACQMAMNGSPAEGGHFLLRNDPLTSGRKLFEKNCGSCHNFSVREKEDLPGWMGGKNASDLGDFASQEWIRGLLRSSMTPNYFGNVTREKKDGDGNLILDEHGKPTLEPALTGMRGWHNSIMKMRTDQKWDQEHIAHQEKDFDLIARWLADQAKTKTERDKELAKDGFRAFISKENKCSNCHTIDKKGGDSAPDLTNYGSAEWIRAMIMRPGHPSRYGEKNHMPAFRNMEGPGSEIALQEFRETNPATKDNEIMNLSDVDRELIIRWMLRDYRPVFGGALIK